MIAGISLYFGYNQFNIHENFTSIPNSFNPIDSTSTYNWNGAIVTIQGGFVKGKIIDDNEVENLVLRSLSPMPSLTVKGIADVDKSYNIRIENVNSVNIKVKSSKIDKQQIVDPHILLIVLNLKRGEEQTVEFSPDTKAEYSEFIILGDNRNGYQTFSQIIDQINAINPVFVIDNGDLVFGGEPNKYRLFYKPISKLLVPLYTTHGNHDIRENSLIIFFHCDSNSRCS
ncbi:MAG TPA: metallophosphoesterase family protein [Ruminiclostridium sp.]